MRSTWPASDRRRSWRISQPNHALRRVGCGLRDVRRAHRGRHVAGVARAPRRAAGVRGQARTHRSRRALVSLARLLPSAGGRPGPGLRAHQWLRCPPASFRLVVLVLAGLVLGACGSSTPSLVLHRRRRRARRHRGARGTTASTAPAARPPRPPTRRRWRAPPTSRPSPSSARAPSPRPPALETKDLVVGTGTTAVAADTVRCSTWVPTTPTARSSTTRPGGPSAVAVRRSRCRARLRPGHRGHEGGGPTRDRDPSGAGLRRQGQAPGGRARRDAGVRRGPDGSPEPVRRRATTATSVFEAPSELVWWSPSLRSSRRYRSSSAASSSPVGSVPTSRGLPSAASTLRSS